MSDFHSRLIAPAGLVIGAVLGMAGTFAPTASQRGLLWGLDGIALIVATGVINSSTLIAGQQSLFRLCPL